MSKFRLAFFFIAILVLAIVFAAPAGAVPEYATQLGEPCATCHLSPAGGGLRNVRGQAWVASDKPAAVPSTADALKILGVQLPSDMSIYTATPAAVPTPAPLKTRAEALAPLLQLLANYEGN